MHPKRSTRNWLALAALAVIIAAVPAQAEILNGDFENGGTDWAYNGPATWGNGFPPAGGNPDGYAVIASPLLDSGGIGCLTQTFLCGEPGGATVCSITLDFWLAPDNSGDPTSGVIKVFIDGQELFSFVGETDGWQTATVTVPCGVHVIDICLEVADGDNGWRACFDNVASVCEDTVAVNENTWSNLKGLFR